jgi:hypothetical protein
MAADPGPDRAPVSSWQVPLLAALDVDEASVLRATSRSASLTCSSIRRSAPCPVGLAVGGRPGLFPTNALTISGNPFWSVC